jgi:hypothetical protein
LNNPPNYKGEIMNTLYRIMQRNLLATIAVAVFLASPCLVHAQPMGEKMAHRLPHIRSGEFPVGRGAPQLGGGGDSGNWSPVLTTPPQIAAGIALLLTDGSVMVQDLSTLGNTWWKLTPDQTGSYVQGTWTQLASMPDGYAPLYFASAVLPDGRVIVEGGQYQTFVPLWQTRGAIYDPTLDTWTSVAPPEGWSTIGDALSAVLADGRFILGNCCSLEMAILDPVNLTWTATGTGKADNTFNGEGWTLLWNGDLLTVDTNNFVDLMHSELFHPATGQWTSGGSTVVKLADFNADGSGSFTIGSAVLRPDGTVFAAGALGQNAIYDSKKKSWSVGPSFPILEGEGQLDQAEGPAALLPNGNVLLAVSAGLFNTPAHFYEFNGRSLNAVATPASAVNDSSYNINLLLLPTGEVLETHFSNNVEIYTPTGRAKEAWRPSVDRSFPVRLQAGRTYSFSGKQLHGLSQAVAYGAGVQAATNYPIVRITNRATGHVFYARTHSFSNYSIAPAALSSAKLDVPANIETGFSDLVVIANGIASEAIHISVY